MANPQLSVEIGAKIDGLRDALNQAVREIDGLDKNTKSKLASIDKSFEKLANDVDGSMKQISNSSKTASNQVTQNLAKAAQISATSGTSIKKGSDQAAFALTNLGRVAQDAPFGFIGIQNNLNPLLESFQRLRAESGSNSAALKALAGSLIGAGGIGLALSVVTSALSFYTMWQQKANKETKEGADANKAYIDTLDQVTRARIKGSQNAQKELVDARLLFDAYQNANLPLNDRKLAYQELQKQYPAYFKNISFEKTASEQTTTAYNALTSSILASARARAASDQLSSNASREFENENKRIDARIKLEDALSKRRRAEQFLSNVGVTAEFSQVRAKYEKEIAGYSETIATNTKIIREANIDTSKLGEFNLRLEKLATGEKIEQLKTTKEENKELEKYENKIAEIYKTLATELKSNPLAFGSTKNDIAEENIKSYQKAIDDLIKNGYQPASAAIQDLINKQQKLFDAATLSNTLAPAASDAFVGGAQERLGNRATPEAQLITELKPPKGLTEYEKLINSAEESNLRFVESISQVGNSLLESSIGDAFSSIGEALASGTNVIDAAGNAILATMASFLSELGKMFIKQGVAQVAAGIALNLIAPGSGANRVAGGIGLIAAGGLISAAGGAAGAKGKKGSSGSQSGSTPIRQFATGGYNLAPGLAIVGENGPEAVRLPIGSSVHNNAKTNRLIGGAQSQQIVIGSRIGFDMGQLVIEIDRERERMRR